MSFWWVAILFLPPKPADYILCLCVSTTHCPSLTQSWQQFPLYHLDLGGVEGLSLFWCQKTYNVSCTCLPNFLDTKVNIPLDFIFLQTSFQRFIWKANLDYLIIYSPNGYNSWSWTKLKQVTWNSMWFLQHRCGPRTLEPSALFS